MSLANCDVRIQKDFVEMTLPNGTKKVITFEDFKHAIDKSVNIQQQQETVFLPPNCYRYARGLSDIGITCYYPEEIREVKYMYDGATKTVKIPFPNIIIHHKLSKNGEKWVNAGTVFLATHKTLGQIGDEAPTGVNRDIGLWPLPFPNMYANASMCYGNNAMPTAFTKNNYRGLNWYFEVLYKAPFNDDLTVPELRIRGSEWLVQLSKLKVFPYAKLSGYVAVPGTTAPEPVPTRAGLTETEARLVAEREVTNRVLETDARLTAAMTDQVAVDNARVIRETLAQAAREAAPDIRREQNAAARATREAVNAIGRDQATVALDQFIVDYTARPGVAPTLTPGNLIGIEADTVTWSEYTVRTNQMREEPTEANRAQQTAERLDQLQNRDREETVRQDLAEAAQRWQRVQGED